MSPPARAGVGALLFGVLLASMVAGRLETAAGCLVVALVAAIAVGAQAPSTRWVVALAGSAVLGMALNLYLTQGTPLTGWPEIAGRAATREGATFGLLLMIRLVAGLAAMRGLARVWSADQAVDVVLGPLSAWPRVRAPLSDLRLLLGLSLRLAPLLETEGRRIAAIQDLRAGGPPRGWFARIARRRAAAVPALVCALERAERVALALEARHYRLRPHQRQGPGAAGGWGWVAAAIFGTALAWR